MMNKKLFWTTAVMTSSVMALIMSGIIVTINTGVDSELITRWMRSFSIAWPIALSLNVLVIPVVRNLAEKICTPKQQRSI
ncbi:DUF2798 domain-containing protein [Vibrio sp. Of7-15]|uniref:DUF2798 domain-containing protein n=1 Tax=Vibrio sp. Of7-15 TaxID=2724879 RepID=UPI001EF181B0|nr:DUF2798 domain-containing protein [Vibrio sp. Of7-15]MCG7499419.1 DUF2798 domain-containing protein [Vibrio sp. Of7-15]